VAPTAEPPLDAAEVTQVVNVQTGEAEADVTQIITDPTKSNEAEHTQIVAPITDERTSPAMPQPQWASLPPTGNASTGIASFPPVAGGPAPTPLDAQDLFTSNKPAQSGPKPWVIAVAVIVVLAIAGGAVWFFGFRDSGTSTADGNPTQTSEPSAQSAPEPVDITKIELPGEAAENSGEMDITRASELAVIAPAEATLLADAGANQVTYSGFSDGNYRFLLYSYKSADAAAAAELTDKILNVQKQLGFTDTTVADVPAGVTLTTVSNSEAAALRGVYTYGDQTIQLSVLQIPVGDIAELHTQFQQAMTAITDAAAPGK
jgi:hypothetical protein